MNPKLSSDEHTREKKGTGLQTELHPALKSSNLTLIKEQQHKSNPYLSTQENTKPRRARITSFYKHGEIINRVSKERSKLKDIEKQLQDELLEQKELEKLRLVKVAKGELPDLQRDEDKFFTNIDDIPEDVEWWDAIFLDKKTQEISKKYIDLNCDSDEDEDDENEEDNEDGKEYLPSLKYIQHPVPEKDLDNIEGKLPTKIYLTKKEHRKIRRNKRKLAREETETKIKLGIEPKPEPKVKLSNMMHVLENNSNIADPTSYEKYVKEQVEKRKEKHLEDNQIRHDEAQKRKHEATVESPANGNVCSVYRFKSLANPKIRYKINMNGKQLSLKGCCLRVSDRGSGMIIAIGTEKSIKFFDKLVTRRIKWDENFEDKYNDNALVDMNGNYIEKVWSGYLENDNKFRGWFMRVCEDEVDLKRILTDHNAESFYRNM